MYRDHELVSHVEDADIILAHVSPITIEKNWNCKFVLCPCTNTNHITTHKSVELLSLKGMNLEDVTATAHHTIFLMLSSIWSESFVLNRFNGLRRPKNPRRSLEGMRVGIIGFGRIGRQVKALCEGFGMKVDWVDKETESITKHELLTQSDVITLHTTIIKDQKPILGKEELKLIKDGAFIINTSRGEAIDESEIKNHICRLGGLAVDVCRDEQSGWVESLLRYDNFIHTPHLGGYEYDSLRHTFKMVWEQFKGGQCLK